MAQGVRAFDAQSSAFERRLKCTAKEIASTLYTAVQHARDASARCQHAGSRVKSVPHCQLALQHLVHSPQKKAHRLLHFQAGAGVAELRARGRLAPAIPGAALRCAVTAGAGFTEVRRARSGVTLLLCATRGRVALGAVGFGTRAAAGVGGLLGLVQDLGAVQAERLLDGHVRQEDEQQQQQHRDQPIGEQLVGQHTCDRVNSMLPSALPLLHPASG